MVKFNCRFTYRKPSYTLQARHFAHISGLSWEDGIAKEREGRRYSRNLAPDDFFFCVMWYNVIITLCVTELSLSF